ncbi:MAG: ATPase involved in chromosome partitioning-like protein [Actinoallomurus sp.]|nr:ATPase involved in chromosome partitioning-like protein [Actinoallomurus sp.]
MTDTAPPVKATEDWQAAVLQELHLQPGMTAFSGSGVPPAPDGGLTPGAAPADQAARPDLTPVSGLEPSTETNGRLPYAAPTVAPAEPAGPPYDTPSMYETTRLDIPRPSVFPPVQAPVRPPAQAPVRPPAQPPEPGRGMHGDPLLRRMGRGVRRAIGVSAAQEVHDWTAVGTGLRQPVTTPRRIVVTSVRGGAGKTTVAVLLASALARHRQDRVLLVDADPGLGSMAARVGVTAAPSLRELAGRRPDSFDEVGPHLTRTDSGLWVLPGVRGEMADEALDLATYEAATSVLTRFFTVVVVDCGAGMVGELPQGILAGAHACVHATPATTEGVVGIGRALDWMGRHGLDRLVPRSMTVFATHAPHARPDLDEAAALLRDNGVGVAYLPYDRHLASGGLLVPSLLAESTRTAALAIAAEALTRANH